jgi:hypothetical protein
MIRKLDIQSVPVLRTGSDGDRFDGVLKVDFFAGGGDDGQRQQGCKNKRFPLCFSCPKGWACCPDDKRDRPAAL